MVLSHWLKKMYAMVMGNVGITILMINIFSTVRGLYVHLEYQMEALLNNAQLPSIYVKRIPTVRNHLIVLGNVCPNIDFQMDLLNHGPEPFEEMSVEIV
tara:strand:- start:18 stop:314 length:297 start_codon:yes stop_codon:yes gene_type:complete